MERRLIRRLIRLCVIAFCVGFIAALAIGCNPKVVFVKQGEPVRLRETIKGAKVWTRDAHGQWIETTTDLPEGYYVLADPGESQ